MLDVLLDAEFTVVEELAATQVELTHAVARILVASSGGKPPPQLQVPRPNHPTGPPVVRGSVAAEMLRRAA